MTKNMISFEISDSYEHHAHIIPLVYEFSKSPTFNITLYSIDQKHIDFFNALYKKLYLKPLNCHINITHAGRTHRLKHEAVKILKRSYLSWTIKALRSLYGEVRGNNKYIEGGNDFYKKNINFFKSQDLILTTELKGGEVIRDLGVKVVFCLHGVISNDNPFFKDWSCDLVISPSVALENKLARLSNFPTGSVIYKEAYLKKEVINKTFNNNHIKNLFENSNFTFLYNPHWDNSLGQSSWNNFGEKILNFFFNNPQYNLIFAPHILLDKYFGLKLEYKYYQAPNMLIDINSDKLCNGFYIPHTDCYMGDVSSQYFEFLLFNKNIQGIFINASLMDWECLNHYEYWKNGEVAESFDELKNLIKESSKQNKAYSKTGLYNQIFSDIPDNQVDKLKEFIVKNYLQ